MVALGLLVRCTFLAIEKRKKKPMDSTMQAPPRLLYPSLVIAAISVSLFSLLGIATLTGYLPVAHSTPQG